MCKRNLDQISQVTVLVQAKQEVKVAKTTGLLAVGLLISFVPGIVVSSSSSLRTSTGIRVSELLMQLSSLVNPLLYCYRNRRFRNAALELFRMKKPQAAQAAPSAVQAVKRKDPTVGSLQNALDQQQNPTKPSRFVRSASCGQIGVGVDCGHRRFESPTVLRKSISDPSLALCSISSDGSRTQQPSCIVTTSATIHADRGALRRKASDAVLPKDADRPQCTEQRTPNSYNDASAFVKDENVDEGFVCRPETAPRFSKDEIVPDGWNTGNFCN